MNTKSFAKEDILDVAGKPSRLPAGSTLLVNGVHVPHPHAEVNLAGAGDARLGDTDAVTEYLDHEGKLVQDELHDEVKPRRLTTDKDAEKLKDASARTAGTATPAKLDLREDPANKVVEEGK